MQKKAEQWEKKFSQRMSVATVMTVISSILACVAIYFMVGIFEPIHELNQATSEIERIQGNAEIVNKQLNTYYTTATGGSLAQATISYRWAHDDVLGAVLAFIGAYWQGILIVILLIALLLNYLKQR